MLFRLSVPIPNQDSERESTYNEYFYFESNTSPTRNQILRALKRQKNQIAAGTLIYNGNRLRETLDVIIQQLELIQNDEFPEVNEIGYTSSSYIETRYGKRKMYLTIIVPMRL